MLAPDVAAATGFKYAAPDVVPETQPLDGASLEMLRKRVAKEVAETYPGFARKVWGTAA